jgi:hypothetical protein
LICLHYVDLHFQTMSWSLGQVVKWYWLISL